MKTFDNGQPDFRYIRVGYIPKEAPIDSLIARLVERIPGEKTITSNWKYVSQESFQQRHPGVTVWSKTNSYHLLFISGMHVARFWTDAKHVSTVDITHGLANVLQNVNLKSTQIPKTCMRKSAPMTHRVTITSIEEMDKFIATLRDMYGIQGWVY